MIANASVGRASARHTGNAGLKPGLLAALTALSISPSWAAELPDQSKAFGEALSACSTPGRDLSVRVKKLTDASWTAGNPDNTARIKRGDALAVSNPPNAERGGSWQDRLNWAHKLSENVPIPSTFKHGGTSVAVRSQDETGYATCYLVTLNSIYSDTVFEDLRNAGGATDFEYGSYGTMYAIPSDEYGRKWRTDIRLHRIDPKLIRAEIDRPLSTTLTATFVTRPER